MSALSDARAERDHLLASVQQQREGIQQALATASGALDAHLEHVGSRRWQLFAEARSRGGAAPGAVCALGRQRVLERVGVRPRASSRTACG